MHHAGFGVHSDAGGNDLTRQKYGGRKSDQIEKAKNRGTNMEAQRRFLTPLF
jgi:hypothetical protein